MTTAAIVHDYLTQRGGAERVVLSMTRAFPRAPVYTSLYDPAGTFPEFRQVDVRPMAVNRIVSLRRHHRLGLPILAPAFSRLRVRADIVLCSSSGWAHATHVEGRKIVYCHTPARWLYQTDRYLGAGSHISRAALAVLRPSLVAWDHRAATTADRYLTNSTAVAKRILETYGIRAEVVPPPYSLDPMGPQTPVRGLEAGFFLCVSRLLPYKNVDVLLHAFRGLEQRLVIVGSGPEEARLQAMAPPNASLVGRVDDAQLRWLYANCHGVVAASYEDYGLTPLEGAAFGKPAAVLRWGGFLDTVVEGVTGVFFDAPDPVPIRTALGALAEAPWDPSLIQRHAAAFSEERFVSRLWSVVA
jgi:glycosyltransferase involved in cell wall biosynthesis